MLVSHTQQSHHVEEAKRSQGNFPIVCVCIEAKRESPSLSYGYRDSFGKLETKKETQLTMPRLWYKISPLDTVPEALKVLEG